MKETSVAMAGGHVQDVDNLEVRKSRDNVDDILINIGRCKRFTAVMKACTTITKQSSHKFGLGGGRKKL